jgi:Fe(3+) dicitrate transport protein
MQGGELVSDGGPTMTTADARAWVHALAVHLTDATTWGPLTVTPGARIEIIATRLRDRLLGTLDQGSPQRVLIPGIGTYLALAPTLGLLAGIQRGFSPAARGPAGSVRPETSVNYEGGVRFSSRRARLEAIGFFNDYSNLTAVCDFASGCTSGQVDTQLDAGRAHIYGAELFSRAEPTVAPGVMLPLTAAYTFTRTKLLSAFSSENPTLSDVMAGDELPFVPRHQLQATAGVETVRGSVAVAATYVSAMREHAGQGSAPSEPRTDPSLLFDVTARLSLLSTGQVYLSVRNVFNEADIAARLPFGARPVAPRWVQVGTKWTF